MNCDEEGAGKADCESQLVRNGPDRGLGDGLGEQQRWGWGRQARGLVGPDKD